MTFQLVVLRNTAYNASPLTYPLQHTKSIFTGYNSSVDKIILQEYLIV
jgi:hypothetical protein